MPVHRPRHILPARLITPEDVYWDRRAVLKSLGLGTIGAMTMMACTPTSSATPQTPRPPDPTRDLYPATTNAAYTVDAPLTPEKIAAQYNNFYEFTTDKERVAELAAGFRTRPWTVEIAGAVEKPRTWDIDTLIRAITLEERVYRFRCVEAWSMVAPWTGFPLAALIKKAQPLSSAKYVRFVTFLDTEQAPGQRTQPWYPWPYFEGLRMDEAMNDLTLLATGIYGHPLPPQHGAPMRLVVPWKYGFKSIKSIVRIEFTKTQPPTFWNTLQAGEYSFLANVNPAVPHPRWSQATERDIATGDRKPTRLYNGYDKEVAGLYKRG